MSLPVFAIIAGAGALVALAAWYGDKQRRDTLAAWTASRGWRLEPGKKRGIDKDYPFLKIFTRGHSRRAKYVITGEFEGHPIRLMDYTYVTGSGKNQTTHRLGVAILAVDLPLIGLTIRRENPLDKVSGFFGHEDINFESAEFSRRYHVSSPDRKWAYDVIHQRAMDFLLGGPGYEINFGFQEIAVTKSGSFDPAGYEAALAQAKGLYDLIPDYVVQKMKGETR